MERRRRKSAGRSRSAHPGSAQHVELPVQHDVLKSERVEEQAHDEPSSPARRDASAVGTIASECWNLVACLGFREGQGSGSR